MAKSDHFLRLLKEKDKRDEQRFSASQKALAAAFFAQEKAVNAALAAADRAVAKAENASEKRFEGLNEFRGSMADMQSTMMPRSEAESRLKSIEDKLGTAINSLQASMDSNFATNRNDISNLQQWKSEKSGASDSTKWIIGTIVLAVTAAAALGALFLHK